MIIDNIKNLWERFKTSIIMSILCLMAGLVIGYCNAPKPEVKIETKIETQVVEKIVEKTVEKKIYLKDKTKTETIIQKPDGTVIHTVTQNDVSVDLQDTKKEKQKETKTKQSVKEVRIITEYPKYSIGLMAESSFKKQPKFTPEINTGYRFYGNIWIEGSYNSSTKAVGVGFKWEIK